MQSDIEMSDNPYNGLHQKKINQRQKKFSEDRNLLSDDEISGSTYYDDDDDDDKDSSSPLMNGNTSHSLTNRKDCFKKFMYNLQQSFAIVLLQSYLNILLIFGPLAYAVQVGSQNGGKIPQEGAEDNHRPATFVFICAALSLIPLAERLSYITECIADQTNETYGSLLNATFGNAPELLISISALRLGYYKMIQITLVGSMITNLMFAFGMACLIGGMRWKQQSLRRTMKTSGNLYVGLLIMSNALFLIPSIIKSEEMVSMTSPIKQNITSNEIDIVHTLRIQSDEVKYSRIIAITSLICYGGYLSYTLCTHKDDFEKEFDVILETAEPSPIYLLYLNHFPKNKRNITSFIQTPGKSKNGSFTTHEKMPQSALPSHVIKMVPPNDQLIERTAQKKEYTDANNITSVNNLELTQDSDVEIPINVATLWLFVITVSVNIVTDVLVDSIDSFSKQNGLNTEFVAAIILPIFSNIAEMASATIFAFRNKMDLCVGVTIGSAIQIALFVFPCIIVFGWIGNLPMRIFAENYMTASLLVSNSLAIGILYGATTSWFVGVILISVHIIIAVGLAFHHIDDLRE